MTIRARLTWWAGGLMAGGLALLAGFAYFEFIHEHPEFLSGQWTAERRAQFAHSLEEVALFAGLPALLLGLAGGWWLYFMSRALKPLGELTEAAERMDAYNLQEPLPRTGNNDEIDRLAAVLNESNHRVSDAFQRVRDFSLHASHELKTPLTVLRASLESCLHDDNLTPAQREQVTGHLFEIDRLARIVEGLTLLTKADANLLQLRFEEVRLDVLVRDAVEDARVLAAPRSIAVTLGPCPPALVSADCNRLRQLLLNLSENAVKYNVDGGRIEVGLKVAAEVGVITFANTGPGLPTELQDRVFDRFFRGDPAHNSDVEGCGLGLSIAQSIARAHGGEILFVSAPGELTTVTVRLPCVKSVLPSTDAGSATAGSTPPIPAAPVREAIVN